MGKRVAVLQSNYIPWKGYFDIIHDVDLFIFYDDLQYTKQDWRNRNRIKTPRGLEWLTIPVGPRLDRLICEVEIKDPSWAAAHWHRLRQHYRRAPHFPDFEPFLEHVYLESRWRNLSELNQSLIRTIARQFLGIGTEIRDSREYAPCGRRQDRLIDLLQRAQTSCYVSGPAAKRYIDPQRFAELGIELIWKDYSGYPEYPQLHPPFAHEVTILDVLFHLGPAASEYIWGWREGRHLAADGLAS